MKMHCCSDQFSCSYVELKASFKVLFRDCCYLWYVYLRDIKGSPLYLVNEKTWNQLLIISSNNMTTRTPVLRKQAKGAFFILAPH